MNPVTQPPYPWAEAVAIGYDEPGHTIIPTGRGYDFTIGEDEALDTLFSTWDASYPNRSSRN